jgi:hypothetical protein
MEEADASIVLPYGLTAAHVVAAVNRVYSYLHAVNSASVMHGYPRLEDIIQPAGFSGLLSESVCQSFVQATATATPGLVRNVYPNGRPDLVPRGMVANDSILRGDEGVEVKISRNPTSWQGHNVESGWLLGVLISVDTATLPVYERAPTTIERVMIAMLAEEDWSFSGRSETSRRTPTASIRLSGRDRLSEGTVYQRGRGVAP